MVWHATVFALRVITLLSDQQDRPRPNIVWFVVVDVSVNLPCYRPVPITAVCEPTAFSPSATFVPAARCSGPTPTNTARR